MRIKQEDERNMPRSNASIVIVMQGGKLKHHVRLNAEQGASIEWEIVNQTLQTLNNVTFTNFKPSNPLKNISSVTINPLKNRRDKVTATVDKQAPVNVYTFDVVADDSNGKPQPIGDPEIEVILDLRETKKPSTKKHAKASKATSKARSRK